MSVSNSDLVGLVAFLLELAEQVVLQNLVSYVSVPQCGQVPVGGFRDGDSLVLILKS